MTVTVNGEDRTIEADATVEELLASLGLGGEHRGPAGVAVVVDRQVVPRGEYASTRLAEGADIELLRAVGGG